MKYLKYSFLLILLATINMSLLAQTPATCTELPVKIKKGPTIPILKELPDLEIQIETPPPPGDDYSPTIIFVHGLNGTENSWSQAEKWTDENYKCQTTLVTYNEKDGLDLSGRSLNENIKKVVPGIMTDITTQAPDQTYYGSSTDNAANRKRNFIIAHSQGGIVSQFAEKYGRTSGSWGTPDFYGNYYGGIVTFATSHQGAYILNSVVEDADGNYVYGDLNENTHTRFENFTKTAIDELGAGTISEFPQSLLFGIFNVGDKITDLGQKISDLFSLKLIPSLVASPKISPTSLGFMVNPTSSQSINELNSYFSEPSTPKIPKVAFYSEVNNEEEQGELIWRAGFWAANSPNRFPINNPSFGGGTLPPLQDGQKQADMYKAKFWEKAEEHRLSHLHYLGMAYNNMDFNFWKYLRIAEEEYGRYQQNLRGYKWFEVANDQFKTLIGAASHQAVEPCYCDCITEDFGADENMFTDVSYQLDDCDQSCSDFEVQTDYTNTTCDKRVVLTKTIKASDGIVLAESASNMAGATINENSDGFTKDDFTLYGAIHQQVRNDKSLKLKMEGDPQNPYAKALYDGKFDSHFKLDK